MELCGFTSIEQKGMDSPEAYESLQGVCRDYGSDIFLEKGKERVLSHEVTHVAQQKRGLVRPTEWVDGAPLNRAPDLERAADGGTVPAGPALPGGQVPVLQLHPEVKVVGSNGKEWVKQLKSAADIMDVLKGGGYEYARLPEGCMEKVFSQLLQKEAYYGSAATLAHSVELLLVKLLEQNEYDQWLREIDPVLRSKTYPKEGKRSHKGHLIKHEAKPLAKTKGRLQGGYIDLYHGSKKGLKELLPAQPDFRDGKVDPSKDGFLSVASKKSGITWCRDGSCYHIRLTEEELKNLQFREYGGAGELRTRFPVPIFAEEPLEERRPVVVPQRPAAGGRTAKIIVPQIPSRKK